MKKSLIVKIILIITLLLCFSISLGEEKIIEPQDEIYETYYKLDTGVIWMWKNSAGQWQSGITPNKEYIYPNELKIELPSGGYDPKVYPLELSRNEENDNFKFEISNKYYQWNNNDIAFDRTGYNDWYYKRSSEKLRVSNTKLEGNYVKFDLSVNLTPNLEFYDVKKAIEKNARVEYFSFFGGEENTPANIIDKFDEMLNKGFGDIVEGKMIFHPIVVEYKLPKTLPTLHVTHHQQDGTPIATYDYDQPLELGEHTIQATEVFNKEFLGSRLEYRTAPTNQIEEAVDSVTLLVDGTC